MNRNDFAAATAQAINTNTGLGVTADHVESIALDIWDAAQANAADEGQFRAALVAGVAAFSTALVEVTA